MVVQKKKMEAEEDSLREVLAVSLQLLNYIFIWQC